jgi:nicotinamide-nucleotide amidase
MPVAVFCIGTEITRGEITNTNATWLAEELTRIGLDVADITVVPDDRSAIVAALERLGNAYELVVCTGGLGPTTDDITSECVAAALGVPLERHEPSYDAIKTRMERFGRAMAPSNAKQADFPRGAMVLPNATGTAPGFSIRVGKASMYFMPGVPSEMKPMFAEHVSSAARGLVTGATVQVRLKTFGMPESTVNDRLRGIEAVHGVVIGYRAHFPEIELKFLKRAADATTAEAGARAAADEARNRLGDVVFAEGDVSLPETVGAALRERSLTLGTAESCTGGLVAELLTEHAGASDFYKGSVVSYANSAKTDLLGVDAALIAEHGAVSGAVARAMAEGARRALGVDVGLSLTGIAGPTGGTPEKPVGLVHFAVATERSTTDRHLVFPGTRRQIRLLSAYAALSLARRVVLGLEPEHR